MKTKELTQRPMRSYTKLGRVIDMELVKRIKRLPCRVCGWKGNNDCDHIRTVGSGGGDTPSNLWSLCRQHHIEKHAIGLKTFVAKYSLPITWDRGYPELILTVEEAKLLGDDDET